MTDRFDFEQYWLEKLSGQIKTIAGDSVEQEVMEGSSPLSDQSPRTEVIFWSQQAMEKLEGLVEQEDLIEIMTGCACRYPTTQLQDLREIYSASGDADRVHRMLQERFEAFLKDDLQLDGPMIREIVQRGWGLAGVKHGNTIIATKIPKSGYLVAYMEEPDPEKRRHLYCHCPRVRDAPTAGESISETYCYCGAGFYKAIWEEITQERVKVRVLESVLAGGEVCTIAITLPHES